MPSSVIVGALVLAWLVVLVPMIARKRQEVARTADSVLTSRVVRSGTVRRGSEEVRAMSDAGADKEPRDGRRRTVPAERSRGRVTSKYYDDDYDYYETDGYPELDDAYLGGSGNRDDDDLDEFDEESDVDESEVDDAEDGDDYEDCAEDYAEGEYDDYEPSDEEEFTDELPLTEEREPGDNYREPAGNRPRPRPREFRPGRGGFDPEAAELSKRAKYAFRRRVVLAMVLGIGGTALVAAIAVTLLWWATLAIALGLTGYLVYLRRQVRMEEEIRQRRLSRMRATGWTVPEHPVDEHDDDEDLAERRRIEADTAHDMLPDFHDETPPQRRVTAEAPPAVPGTAVVDVDDEDPAFDDLADPGALPYRKAAGE